MNRNDFLVSLVRGTICLSSACAGLWGIDEGFNLSGKKDAYKIFLENNGLQNAGIEKTDDRFESYIYPITGFGYLACAGLMGYVLVQDLRAGTVIREYWKPKFYLR